MDKQLPGIVVTGASGFVGRHFLASAAGRYRLFCLARRSRSEAGVPEDPNLRWTQVDIAKWDTMRQVVNCVKEHGGADYVLHLAGYYDFKFMEHPEYERTNVLGTRNVLKLAKQLGVKRFLFASSLAACRFPPAGGSVNEDSPADAEFAYARSKRQGEDMVRDSAEWFPGAIIRLAAVFSDWCEYPPLYVFLQTWLGQRWNSRILGGKGNSAVTYIHIQDLVKLFHTVIEKSDSLPRIGVYNASPNFCTSHRDLFQIATRYYTGEQVRPLFMPRRLAGPGIYLRWWLGRLVGRIPFEAPWMTRYIDRQLVVDASRTYEALGWSPARRSDISRRLLLMIENMKAHRETWNQRNEAALRRVARRPNFVIAEALQEMREHCLGLLEDFVADPGHRDRFPHYSLMEPEAMRWFLTLIYQVLYSAVQTRDRQLMRHYAQVIAARRRQEGFEASEVMDLMTSVGEIVSEALRRRRDLEDLGQQIHDHVVLSFQLAIDAVEDAYETMESRPQELDERLGGVELPTNASDLEHMVHQLSDICDEALPSLYGGTGRPLTREQVLGKGQP
ncbi:MAG: NAD-dependent epimerase/dehydratase family protein [Candidatus Krumholzibacteriia bacterium]